MHQYDHALHEILNYGTDVSNRTGIDARTIFGYQMEAFDLSEGFPAVTSKRLAWKAVVSELLWFLEGSTDERRLAEILYDKSREELVGKKTIWTDNADKQGVELGYENTDLVKELGPVYGAQWRNFNGVDQIRWIIDRLVYHPDCRRIILSAWNPADIPSMALPPCHTMAQFRVLNGRLNCQLYQRSCDMFLGVPFNIASYSLLTHILAEITDLKVGNFIWTGGDCHIYHNHFDAVDEYLSREPRDLPKLLMPKLVDLDSVLESTVEEYVLEGYYPHGPIKAPMAV